MATHDGTTAPDPFRVLQYRVAEIHWRWKIWKQLFCESGQDNYRLMKRHAPAFFALVQQVLFDDLILQLCKLADPPEGGPKSDRRTNLVLQGAIEDAKPRLGVAASGDIERLIGELDRQTTTLRKWRNRRIAHHDKRTAIRSEPLDPIKFADVDCAIELVTEITKRLDDSGEEFAYNGMIANGDGESLLQSLRWADQHVQEATAQHRHP